MKRQSHAQTTKQPAGRRADAGWMALWGSAAILFALVGTSSIYLAGGDRPALVTVADGQMLLPPAGDVGATASIGGVSGGGGRVEIYPSHGGVEAEQARRLLAAELETLRREVAALRRGLAILQEQRAISGQQSVTPAPGDGPEPAPENVAPPQPGASAPGGTPPEASAAPESFRAGLDKAVEEIAGKPTPVETLPAPRGDAGPAASRSAADGPSGPSLVEAALPDEMRKPVRIVTLTPTPAPRSTASIPRKPVRQPKPLSVTRAAGHLEASDGARIARTDFALDLGLHDSARVATEVWSEIRSAQTLLPPQIRPQTLPAGNGRFRLVAGPFHNAADAAAACVYLAGGDVACTPIPYPASVTASR